ncbi:MAG: M48 family metalloprotease [Thioalkalivibrionaceae bacterium]
MSLIVVTCLALTALLTNASAQNRLPDLGGDRAGTLTPTEERAIGERLLREVRRVFPLIEDPELQNWLDSVGTRLVSAAPGRTSGATFLIIDDDAVNAFAMPGGIIGLHAGLLELAERESEAAGVVAHELAHVTQRHIARMFARSPEWGIATGLAILAAAVAASVDPALGQAALAGGLAASAQTQINFTRANEAEADRVGIQILADAGFDPAGMADFFDRMQALDRLQSSGGLEYLRTHPLTLRRVSEARSLAANMPRVTSPETDDFAWFRARLDGLRHASRYADRNANDDLERYRRTIALMTLGRGEEARRIAETIGSTLPTLTRELLVVHVALASDEPEAALMRLDRIAEIYPEHPAVLHWRVKALSAMGRDTAVLRAVDDAVRRIQPAPLTLLREKALAADRLDQRSLAAETMGRFFFEQGRYRDAIEQFESALAASDAQVTDIERIEARRQRAADAINDLRRR